MTDPTNVHCRHGHSLARRLFTVGLALVLVGAGLGVLGWHVYNAHDVSMTVLATVGGLLFAGGYLLDNKAAVKLADAVASKATGLVKAVRGGGQ